MLNTGFPGFIRTLAITLAATTLVACGGGGGGGDGGSGGTGGNGGNNGGSTSLQLSTNAVTFTAFAGDSQFESKTVQVTWTGSRVAGYVVGTLPGQSLPSWVAVSGQGSSSPSTITISRFSGTLPVGHYTTTLRVVTGDANENVLNTADFTVTLDVVAPPAITPNPVALTWVESEQPAAKTLTAAHDSHVQLTGATVDVSWLSVSTSGDTITISGNAESQLLTPGTLPATLTATFNIDSTPRTVTVPISSTVNPALSTDASPITLEVNASTLLADLSAFRATVKSATATAVQVSTQSDASWLTVTGGSSANVNNLSLVIDSTKLSQLPDGVHHATITATAPNVTPLSIPVELTLRLPEVHFVAPVAFTDTVASEEVIVRGQGFDDPAVQFQIAGVPIVGGTRVSDTEFRFVPGARAAGDYTVTVPNSLGFTRSTANLRVTAPPAYGNYAMSAPYGTPLRIISSPINSAVFAQICFFCQANTAAAASTVYRYEYDSGLWLPPTLHGYSNLIDIALSPDESKLIVLTTSLLMIVDPQTMATLKTVTLPDSATGVSRQLAVLNSGLVIIGGLKRAYDLFADNFVVVDNLAAEEIEASRDGSRAMNGAPTNGGNVAYRYFDAGTASTVLTNTFEHFAYARYSRHATRGFVNSNVLDKNLAVLGTLPLTSFASTVSPDGTRVYGVDPTSTTNPRNFRIFDISGPAPFTELTPIPITITGGPMVEPDPRGNAVFVIDEANFIVVDLP
jgi:hypothetical protein